MTDVAAVIGGALAAEDVASHVLELIKKLLALDDDVKAQKIDPTEALAMIPALHQELLDARGEERIKKLNARFGPPDSP